MIVVSTLAFTNHTGNRSTSINTLFVRSLFLAQIDESSKNNLLLGELSFQSHFHNFHTFLGLALRFNAKIIADCPTLLCRCSGFFESSSLSSSYDCSCAGPWTYWDSELKRPIEMELCCIVCRNCCTAGLILGHVHGFAVVVPDNLIGLIVDIRIIRHVQLLLVDGSSLLRCHVPLNLQYPPAKEKCHNR